MTPTLSMPPGMLPDFCSFFDPVDRPPVADGPATPPVPSPGAIPHSIASDAFRLPAR
jgi:hypothetical protein